MSKITLELDLHDLASIKCAATALQAAVAAAEEVWSPLPAKPQSDPSPATCDKPDVFGNPKPAPHVAAPVPVPAPPVTPVAETPLPPAQTAPPAPAPVSIAALLAAATAPTPDPAPFAAAGPEIDSHGLPWDARINNSKKSLMAGGAFKLLPKPAGYDTKESWMSYVGTVRAELRSSAAPLAPAAVPVGHTFGTLAHAIQTAAISEVRRDEAITQASGGAIDTFALLASRPEFIPAVAQALNL